jgi:hypothetical protein
MAENTQAFTLGFFFPFFFQTSNINQLKHTIIIKKKLKPSSKAL